MSELSRKDLEKQFHDEREELRIKSSQDHDAFYSNRRFYKTATRSKNYLDKWLKTNVQGKKVLDYCCGIGNTAIQAATYGADVIGIDISGVSIETCKARAVETNLQDRTDFYVMDAENTDFDNDTFDVIICNGVLHHLELQSAYRELARVLKPDGKIICIEALANNPIIHWYRRRTPDLRTEWEVEHILTTKRINLARDSFGNTEIKYFHLASIAAIPMVGKPGFGVVLSVMNTIDDVLLSLPGIRRFAWQAIFVLSDPKKPV